MMMMRLKVWMLFFLMFGASPGVVARVTLPKIFTDNMVLQRDKPIKIWGWGDADKTVTVNFNRQRVTTTVNRQGQWNVTLAPMAYGGPFEMVIDESGSRAILHNILLGDVWICSGQSNMEMPLQGWSNDSTLKATKAIHTAQYPQLRLFTVQKATSFTPVNDFEGGSWQVCTPGSAASFSAVAYYFGRKLNQDLHIPIGLINTSWGGTTIQSWISWDTMGQVEDYKKISVHAMQHLEETWEHNRQQYEAALQHDPGISETWYAPEHDISAWKKIVMPQSYAAAVDGIIWYRKDFEVQASQLGKSAWLMLGVIDDQDETYINGKRVGKTDNWYTARQYRIEEGILHAGTNSMVIKVTDGSGNGGFSSDAKDLFLKTGDSQQSLAGEWLYRPAVTTTQFDVHDKGPNAFPSQLYNAMVAPLINVSMTGVIWYQGEANTGEAERYQTLFPALINDWRMHWHTSFPFLWVQLANFKQPSAQPVSSEWAALREAQHKALILPQTGEAIIIDTGEANDIHPKNKYDVGYRLGLAALKIAYQKNVIHSGPVFQSMRILEDKIELTFTQTGSSLVARGDRYGYVKGFSVAGEDRHFGWAKAYIEGNTVIVFRDDVKQPVAVRYAWSDNPDDANLYNAEGLPASPFRTDQWKEADDSKE